MFGLFNKNMDVESARRKLRKLDRQRAKLLKIINGDVVSEDDIEHGVSVMNTQGTVYVIKSEGFGLFNIYSNNGFIETRALPDNITKYDLAEKLNEFNFKVVG